LADIRDLDFVENGLKNNKFLSNGIDENSYKKVPFCLKRKLVPDYFGKIAF
jgi:hypothetical protein